MERQGRVPRARVRGAGMPAVGPTLIIHSIPQGTDSRVPIWEFLRKCGRGTGVLSLAGRVRAGDVEDGPQMVVAHPQIGPRLSRERGKGGRSAGPPARPRVGGPSRRQDSVIRKGGMPFGPCIPLPCAGPRYCEVVDARRPPTPAPGWPALREGSGPKRGQVVNPRPRQPSLVVVAGGLYLEVEVPPPRTLVRGPMQ